MKIYTQNIWTLFLVWLVGCCVKEICFTFFIALFRPFLTWSTWWCGQCLTRVDTHQGRYLTALLRDCSMFDYIHIWLNLTLECFLVYIWFYFTGFFGCWCIFFSFIFHKNIVYTHPDCSCYYVHWISVQLTRTTTTSSSLSSPLPSPPLLLPRLPVSDCPLLPPSSAL